MNVMLVAHAFFLVEPIVRAPVLWHKTSSQCQCPALHLHQISRHIKLWLAHGIHPTALNKKLIFPATHQPPSADRAPVTTGIWKTNRRGRDQTPRGCLRPHGSHFFFPPDNSHYYLSCRFKCFSHLFPLNISSSLKYSFNFFCFWIFYQFLFLHTSFPGSAIINNYAVCS